MNNRSCERLEVLLGSKGGRSPSSRTTWKCRYPWNLPMNGVPSAMAPQTAFPQMTWPQKLVWMTETNTYTYVNHMFMVNWLNFICVYIYTVYTYYTHHLYTNWIEAIWMIYISYILKPNFRCEIDVAHPTSVLPGSLEPPGQPHTPRVKCRFTDSPGQNRLVTLQGINISPFKRHFWRLFSFGGICWKSLEGIW